MPIFLFFFFFNDTATTEIYTLSLHDALPIYMNRAIMIARGLVECSRAAWWLLHPDRKSTRLNSSHLVISYAVFCLKKKNNTNLDKNIITSYNIYISSLTIFNISLMTV